MFAMYRKQGVDGIGVPRPGVPDHGVQHPVGGDRRLPRERLVDPGRAPVGVHQQVLRPLGKAEGRAGHGLPGLDLVRAAGRELGGRGGPRKRRLVAETSRDVHGPEQHLQHVQRPAGLEPVGVGGDAAHRMERDRASPHRLVAAAVHVRPRDVEGHGLREGGVGDLRREAADGGGRDSRRGGDRLRGVPGVEAAPREELEGGPRGRPVREAVPASKRGTGRRVRGGAKGAVDPVPHERPPLPVAREEPVPRIAGRLRHQPRGVRVRREIAGIDLARAQQLVGQRQDEEAVRPRGDPDPLVRDRGVPGADRVDRHHLRAALLEPREPELDGVAVVVLRDPEQHEPPRVLPVRLAELPERSADRIEAGRGHVDRAEPPVGRMVGGPEPARPPAGEGLALVAPGEERELAGVGLADRAEPLDREPDGLLPRDLPELPAPALAGAKERSREARRRVVLHDAGGALRAEHAAVDGVIGVAFDVPDRAVLQVHPDPAPAGAHVAGGGPDLVADRGGVFDPAFHRVEYIPRRAEAIGPRTLRTRSPGPVAAPVREEPRCGRGRPPAAR